MIARLRTFWHAWGIGETLWWWTLCRFHHKRVTIRYWNKHHYDVCARCGYHFNYGE